MRAAALTVSLLAATVTLAPAITSPPVPALTGPVVDTAGVLAGDVVRATTTLARELRTKTGAEIAVLTVHTTAPVTPFDYGIEVLDSWKLGREGSDDGLLLLVVVKDREVRFFQGYGLEAILPDGPLGAILDAHVMPAFRDGEVGGGVYAGLRAAADVIAEEAGVSLEGSLPVARERVRDEVDIRVLLLLLLVVLVVSLLATRMPRSRGHPPIFRGGYGGGFGSGGFRRGGFGGGFGGGGRFGGGGAGRSW